MMRSFPVIPARTAKLRGEDELERIALAWAARNRARRDASPVREDFAIADPLGEIDPTRGAVRYHRHDEEPHWARWLDPVALIGSYLFYAD
jgi:hypothetical protein